MAHHHFTRDDRVLLAKLRTAGLSVRSCARILRFHPSSVYRELKRGAASTAIGYSVRVAGRRNSALRSSANQQHRKLTEDYAERVIFLLQQYWSPEQIAHSIGIAHSTIYRWLWSQSKTFINWVRQYLRHPKMRRKYGTKRREKQRELLKKRWIHTRPKTIDDRMNYGHWEGDTVVGKNRSGYLVTLVERKSGYALVGHIPVKTKEAFRLCAEQLLKPLPEHLKRSITLDNGTEMSDFEELEKHTRAIVYFAHPYHSWERGCNENFNGLLRQFYPKNRELTEINTEELDLTVNLLNTRPRKRHNWRSPEQLLKPYLRVAI